MASIIHRFNYDIFISYRQKDNKGDKWVSEFVEALKTELESTFKEEISVYFDINPHDGLLETHDVDESLKEKLRCLIFIPIISRTYCDPKAFAWEHEFKAFVEQASKDAYGLKVRLSNGNVASRVLPIVIYDLDKQDIKLCESVLGSVLRGVEFIYKTAGVNRPLRSIEEKPHDNLNDTLYRDQVNKVANTIKDVLNSLTAREPSVDQFISEPAIANEQISTKKPIKKKSREIPTASLLYRLKNLITSSQRTWHIVILTLSFLLLGAGAFWLGQIKKAPPDRALTRYDIPLTNALGRIGRKALALSPDGENLVYVTFEGLNLIQLYNDAPPEPISGTSNSLNPFFSPDGAWIGFEQGGKLMKIPLTGGNPVTICDIEAEFGMNQANWYENDIIFAVGSSIYRVPDSGGTPELLYPLNRSEYDPILWNPQLLPDKKTLLFSQELEEGGWSIMTWRLGSKESPIVLVERGTDGRYIESGHIAYTLNNRIHICKFNSKTNRIISKPQIVETNPVMESFISGFGPSQYDFSDNGVLVYYEQLASELRNLVWVDESGTIDPITRDAKTYQSMAISSDAQYIVSEVFMGADGYNIYIIDTETGDVQLIVEDNASDPAWSADNSTIYYVSSNTGFHNQVFQIPHDQSKSPELLFEIDSALTVAIFGLSSDERYFLFDANFGVGFDIGYYDMINSKVEMLNYNSEANESLPAISPDGEWLAYQSNSSGQSAIYMAPFPGPGIPRRVSSSKPAIGAYCPKWAPDMTALYYLTNNPDYELWKVNLHISDNDFDFDPPQSIFNGGSEFRAVVYTFEIHPNGDRFLMQKTEYETGEGIEPRIKAIVNWEQELEGN